MPSDVNTQELERSITKRLFFVAGITLAVGAGLLWLMDRSLVSKMEGPDVEIFNGGQSPVVLIGDSMVFKAGHQKNSSGSAADHITWTYDAADSFLVPKSKISTVAVKAYGPDHDDQPRKNDTDKKTDKFRADVSQAGSWELDEYVLSVDTAVVSIAPGQNPKEIHLKVLANANYPKAKLCQDLTYKNRIFYSLDGTCSDKVQFVKIGILLDTVPTGSIDCQDGPNNQGLCRIVLR